MGSESVSIKKELFPNKKENKLVILKSDYFLRKLFNNIQIVTTLKLIRYNKNIQKRLNIDINAYKEYNEIKSPIELEIIPIKNEKGKYINIQKQDSSYFHIYFNDNKEEIKRHKRTYLKFGHNITKINIIIDYQVTSFSKLFASCNCIESIRFKKFYRNNILYMDNMFSDCISLKKLVLTNFNTNNVINMSCMFSGCSSLKELDISNFNTNNVTDMSFMFSGLVLLEKLNLSNFITNNVINMREMFRGCIALKELNLSNFNTDNVTDMHCMFYYCLTLEKLNISNFNVSNATNMEEMFKGCESLSQLNISNFIFNNKSNINGMIKNSPIDLKIKILKQFQIL